jgi:16S rRNA (adenine1518-N6/adenine1519-N6)-dimethyltransferase
MERWLVVMHMTDELLPNKDLGQHWLNDMAVLESIIQLADTNQEDAILEIGPGLGSLTELLTKNAGKVVAVEFDQSLIAGLEQRFSSNDKITIINEDIRRFDLTSLPTGYKCVANIPYYLTSFLVRLISQSSNPPFLAVLLVQQEVAERLAAKEGQMSILAVIAQTYWLTSLGPLVNAELFTPPPKVNSQVIKLVRRKQPLLPTGLEKEYIQLVKIGFSQKRKTLLNSLSGGLHLDKLTVRRYIASTKLDLSVRAQELSLDQWGQLTEAIFRNKDNK